MPTFDELAENPVDMDGPEMAVEEMISRLQEAGADASGIVLARSYFTRGFRYARWAQRAANFKNGSGHSG